MHAAVVAGDAMACHGMPCHGVPAMVCKQHARRACHLAATPHGVFHHFLIMCALRPIRIAARCTRTSSGARRSASRLCRCAHVGNRGCMRVLHSCMAPRARVAELNPGLSQATNHRPPLPLARTCTPPALLAATPAAGAGCGPGPEGAGPAGAVQGAGGGAGGPAPRAAGRARAVSGQSLHGRAAGQSCAAPAAQFPGCLVRVRWGNARSTAVHAPALLRCAPCFS